jgi:predicted metal-dependent peptidase
MNFEERIDLAASKMGLREPFIAAVTSQMKRIMVTDDPEFTAATNGTWLKFGVQWGEQWNDEELFGLYLHESLHVILMHMWRRGDRHPGVWNTANDAIINRIIKNKGYSLPKVVLRSTGCKSPTTLTRCTTS